MKIPFLVHLIFHPSSESARALAMEIHRALNLAKEFNLDIAISGAKEAWKVIDRLKFIGTAVIDARNITHHHEKFLAGTLENLENGLISSILLNNRQKMKKLANNLRQNTLGVLIILIVSGLGLWNIVKLFLK